MVARAQASASVMPKKEDKCDGGRSGTAYSLCLGSPSPCLERPGASYSKWVTRGSIWPLMVSKPHQPNSSLRGASNQPLLLVDVDGVISLFGFDHRSPPAGRYQLVDGIAHFLSVRAGEHLRRLGEAYELAWCTGWE